MALARARKTPERKSRKAATRAPKYVYFFADGKAEGSSALRPRLGGKGSELAEMTNLGVPVPPGFTITTDAWAAYNSGGKKYPARSLEAGRVRLEAPRGCRSAAGWATRRGHFSCPSAPAPAPRCPGMMDTVLNLGLNDQTVVGLARRTKNERFAWDCYRRFLTIFGHVVLDVDRRALDALLDKVKERTRRDHRRGRARRCAEGAGGRAEAAPRGAHRPAVPAGSARPAPARHRRGVRLVVGEEGRRLPPHPSHVRRLGHGGDGDGDGVRQPRRDVGHRRVLLARSRERRAALLRRVPRQRPG